MAWELEIHQIDVGQGESALIVAMDASTQQFRTMLIDGGLQDKAGLVASYALTRLPSAHKKIDLTLTTHWDEDHSYGMTALLEADNLTILVDELRSVARSAHTRAKRNDPIENQWLLVASELAYICRGGWSEPVENRESLADLIVSNAKSINGKSFKYICNLAIKEVTKNETWDDPSLFYRQTLTAVVTRATKEVFDSIFGPLRELLGSKISENSNLNTLQMFRESVAIDIGDIEGGSGVLAKYKKAVKGELTLSGNHVVDIPWTRRKRLAPSLGEEILWGSKKGVSLRPKGAPGVYVFAVGGEARNGNGKSNAFNGDQLNKVSIGMVIRFNKFVFFTGGDLPHEGEELLAYDLCKGGKMPWDDDFVPTHCCALKCSHHGSKDSTRQELLKLVKPAAATISCGAVEKFDHPNQEVIDVLFNASSAPQVYMTTCAFVRKHVPDLHEDQLQSGNRFFVAGDDLQPGHIVIKVTEAQSISKLAMSSGSKIAHGFTVEYYDKDEPIQNSNLKGGTRAAPHDHAP